MKTLAARSIRNGGLRKITSNQINGVQVLINRCEVAPSHFARPQLICVLCARSMSGMSPPMALRSCRVHSDFPGPAGKSNDSHHGVAVADGGAQQCAVVGQGRVVRLLYLRDALGVETQATTQALSTVSCGPIPRSREFGALLWTWFRYAEGLAPWRIVPQSGAFAK